MARIRDLTGNKYGLLIVRRCLHSALYGGRVQSKWLCECECGREIELFYDQLPTTAKRIESMMHSGRRLYDRCEECRQKICPICRSLFSYSHSSYICPSPKCQSILEHQRSQFAQKVRLMTLRENPELYKEYKAQQRKYWKLRKIKNATNSTKKDASNG